LRVGFPGRAVILLVMAEGAAALGHGFITR
jgi:hypothetical protein